MNKKIIVGSVVGIVLLVVLLWWVVKESNKPLPGQIIPDIGRDHLTDIYGIEYNSNPPTSGRHFPVWAKPGVYDRVLSDGYLIHSLEHGYVIISYNCDKIPNPKSQILNKFQISNFKFQIVSVYAHEEEDSVQNSASTSGSTTPLMHMNKTQSGAMNAFTPSDSPAVEVELPDSFKTNACKDFVKILSKFTKEAQRIIIVPRPTLDVPVALTAWGRLLKLEKIDEGKIKEFIASFNNKGPEATVE